MKICSKDPSFKPRNQFQRPYFENLGGTYLPKNFSSTSPLPGFVRIIKFLQNIIPCTIFIPSAQGAQINPDDGEHEVIDNFELPCNSMENLISI